LTELTGKRIKEEAFWLVPPVHDAGKFVRGIKKPRARVIQGNVRPDSSYSSGATLARMLSTGRLLFSELACDQCMRVGLYG
jgi:hypothetical protein